MHARFKTFGLILFGAVLGIMLSLNYSAIAERKAQQLLPFDELRTFAEIFGRIKNDYVDQVEDKKLITGAINGMLSNLDPHSSYLDGNAFKDLQAGTQGVFGGLGIEVGMEDGFVKVISPIEDTPAYKAGLKPGDLIIKLDDTSVKGLSLNDAVKIMRGEPDTQIVLTVLHKGDNKPRIVTITRAIIKVQSVKHKTPEPGFAYIRITQFQERTVADLAKALKTIREENNAPLKGMVLDLRNNPGGLLNAAVGVSAAFMPINELVVYTEGRVAESKMQLIANANDYARKGEDDPLEGLSPEFKKLPIVVLINGGSASASEIVAGALQDQKRAVIMGTQSFGKGSVQTILPMNNGTAIKLTTARYFTPKGRSIQAKGIVPDIVVEDMIDTSFRVREADLKSHLSNPKDSKTADDEPAKAVTPEKENKDSDSKTNPQMPVEFGSKDDMQFVQAMNLLKGMLVLQK